MARVLDTAAVRVQAETRGGERDAARAGQKFGREFTKAADKEVGRSDLADKLAGQVDSASSRVVKARSKEARAAGQVRVAELRLKELRDKGKASAAQLAAAENRLGDARRGLVAAQRDADAAARKLDVSERRLADAHALAAGEADKQRKATDQLGDSVDKATKDKTGKVKLEPLDAEFARDLRATITRIARTVSANIPLNARGERFRREVAARIREVETTLRARIDAEPNLPAGFRRELKTKVDAIARTVRSEVRVGVNVDRDGNALTRLFGRMGGLATKAGSAIASGLSTGIGALTSLASSALSAVSGVVLLAVKAALLSPLLAGIAGAATAAFGAVTAAALGLPVVLATLIGPIAAIVLGMEGIRKAAGTLKPEFDHLKKSLSDTFERGLKPVFEAIRPIFPIIERGLNAIAFQLSSFALLLAKVFTSAAGLELIESIFSGINTALSAALPGLGALAFAMAFVAGQEPLFRILGDTIEGVTRRFANILTTAAVTGALEGALTQLKDVLFEVTDLLAVLAQGSLEFFTGAGPGITGFFHEIGEALRSVDWAALGETFGGLLERVGKAIRDIPPETWERLVQAIGALALKFVELIESGALESMITNFARLVEILPGVIDFLVSVASLIASLLDPVGSLGGGLEWVKTKFTELGDAISGSGIKDSLGSVDDSFDEFISSVSDRIGRFYQWLGIASPSKLFRDIGIAIVEGLIAGLAGGPDAIWAKIKEIGQSAKNALSDAGTLLYNLGGDIARGLANGIRSGVSSVVSAARSMAQQAWEAAKAIVRPGSPSKLFRELGLTVGPGLAAGIVAGTHDVLDAIARMLSGVTGLLPAGLGASVTQALNTQLAQFGPASAVTAQAVGSGRTPGVDLPTLMEGLTRVLNAAELKAGRDGIVLMVNDGNRMLARR